MPLFSVPSAAPANVQVDTATDTSLTFTWDEVPCGSRGGEITRYRYSFAESGESFDAGNTFDTSDADRSITRTGLTCNTEYIFRVAAINGDGVGPYSSTVTATSTYSGTGKYITTILLLHQLTSSYRRESKIRLQLSVASPSNRPQPKVI